MTHPAFTGPPPYDVRFLEGVRCYNRRRFYEAHEFLEDVWHEWGPPHKTFLQALIQMAVACLHLEMKNVRGATTMSGRVIGMLRELPDAMWGLEVRKIGRSAEEFFAPLHDPVLLEKSGMPDPLKSPQWGWPEGAPLDYERPSLPEKPA